MLEEAWMVYGGETPIIYQSNLASILPVSRRHTCLLGPYQETTVKLSSQPARTPSQPELIRNRMLLRKNLQGKMELGPIIAILTSKGKNGSFKGNRSNYKDIMRTAQELGGLVYVVTPEGVDFKQKKCHGYIWSFTLKRWLQLTFPFPHIFYNRIPYRHDESQPLVQQLLSRLQQLKQVHLYPDSFFDKWLLFQWLQQDSELTQYLPDTKLLTKESLQQMYHRYGDLYLKPIHGKAGQGMIRMTQQGEQVQVIHQLKNRRNHWKFSSLPKAIETIHLLIKSKDYLVQQAIPLAQVKQSPFDIRILVMRDGQGKWKVTGIGVRVAGQGGITTHVPQGGRIISFQQMVQQVFPKRNFHEFEQQVEQIALLVAHNLERIQPKLAEFSMDLGVTAQGSFWIFEANAKPMKFDEPHIRQRSLQRLIQYAQYRSGFRSKTGGGAR